MTTKKTDPAKAELNRMYEVCRKLEADKTALQDEMFRLKEKVQGLEAELKREKQHVDILFKGFKRSLEPIWPFTRM